MCIRDRCIGEITRSRHVGILATAGTIKSESYLLEIHKLSPDIVVTGEACPDVYKRQPLTRMLVHKKRAEQDAILVGRRTALLDNPSLSTRNWYGKHPVRLVIDKELTLPLSLIHI